MKILQVNCVYNKGSTGKITYDIHQELLSRGDMSVVCYGRGEKIDAPFVYKTCGEIYSKINHAYSMLSGILYGGCYFSTKKLISIIKKEKPDIVHLHCINGYFVNIYKLVEYLKRTNQKTVITLHAEFMHTANCSYAYDCEKWKTGCGSCPALKAATKSLFFDRTHTSWIRMKNAFNGFEGLRVISVSPWLMERAIKSPIMKDLRHNVILNGLDTSVFTESYNNDLKKQHNIQDEKIIFHATPVFNNDKDHVKGGHYVIELAKKMIADNVKFIIAGKYPQDLVVPENMILLGSVSDPKKLAQYYSIADVTLLTSKRETFSMICAESLSCGTPVVGFEAGAPEQIAIPEYSIFVKHGDMSALHNGIKEMLEKKLRVPVDMSRLWYDKKNMIDKYIDEYKALLFE